MAEIKCPQCEKMIPEDAPGGLCQACLLKLAMKPESTPSSASTAAYGQRSFAAPSIAELAPLFPQLEILEQLGQGGMGAVYKARQSHLDRLIAIKILPKTNDADGEFANRFTREAKAMAKLNHPSIVNIHDYGTAGNWYFLIMEYVDGINLRQAIHSKSVAPKQALEIVGQVCDAMNYAHEEGVVHRDIKPENILLDKRGRIKIADFGLAKLMGASQTVRPLTMTNQIMGTMGYMAPEQLEGAKQVDHRADLYAVGVVFYELLTGELPIGRFPPPSQKVQIDVRVDEVVFKTLEKEPARRYQYASEIKNAVEHISQSAAPLATVAPSEASRWWLNPTLIGALLLAMGILEYLVIFMAMAQLATQKRYERDEIPWIIGMLWALGICGGAALITGGLTLWRRFRKIVILGSVICLLPLVPFASLLKPTSAGENVRILSGQVLPRGVNIPSEILGLEPEILLARWQVHLLAYVGMALGLWSLLVVLDSRVSLLFRRKSSQVSVGSSQEPTLIHARMPDNDGLSLCLGMASVILVSLGLGFVIWISSAFLTGQPIRFPFKSEDPDAWVFILVGLAMLFPGVFLYSRQWIQRKSLAWTLSSRLVLFLWSGITLLAGMIILFLSIVHSGDLVTPFGLVIRYGSEAACWISSLLCSGILSGLLAMLPLDRTKAPLLFGIGLSLLCILVTAVILIVPSVGPVRPSPVPSGIPQNIPTTTSPFNPWK